MSKFTEFLDKVDSQDGAVRNWLYKLRHPARVAFFAVVALLVIGLLMVAT